MHIKSVEALKSWLTTRLESVCDADPAALAKYVVALVKKDKPVQELKDICVDQLEVFLSDETLTFVNMLFDALTSYSYLPQPHLEASSVLAVPTPTQLVPTPLPSPLTSTSQDKPRKPSFSEDVLTTRVLDEPDDDDRDFKRTRRTTDLSDRSSTVASSGVSPSGEKSRKRRADDDGSRIEFSKVPKDEVSQTRRVDSQTKDELNQRNKSDAGPYDNATYPIPSAMHRDRGSKHFDNQDGSGRSSGSNSHEEMSGRRGSPPWERRSDRMGRGGRSYRDRYREDRSRHGGRDERERGGLRRSRCRDYDEKGFCMRGELCPYDHGNDPVVVQDVIPGILGMTGPPFLPDVRPIPGTALPGTTGPVPGSYPPSTSQPPPPGTTGTIPTSTPKSNQNQEGPKTSVPVSGPHPSAPSRIVPLEHSHPPVLPPHPVHMLQRPMLTTQGPRPPFNNPFEDSYNPEQPQFDRGPVWMRLGNGRPPHPIPPHGVFHPAVNVRSRELLAVTPNQPQLTIQVPGLATQGQRMPIVPERTIINADAQNQSQKQQPSQQQAPAVTQQPTSLPNASLNHSASVKSRLGYPRKLSDTLELKKIPQDMNKIAKLNEYFQRFGTITNIQVCAFGNPEAALIQFSQHREAKAAYSCPDAVFGNRFIRVFWYNPERQQHDSKDGGSTTVPTENKISAGSTTPEVSAKEISSKPEAKPKPTMFQSGKTTFLKTGKPLLGLAHNSPGLTKKQQEQLKQEAVRKKLEIQKQKQELLNKQIQEQKNLISKLEKKNLNPTEKELILKTIKSLSSNIEALKKEVELAAMAAKSKESPSQARQIAQRAILDQELDLISHQNTGEDTTELKKKVEELKQEAKSLGLLDPPGRGRGRGVTRGRGRGLTLRGRPFSRTTRVWTRESAALDHRPKQITVCDITPEQKEDITEHFKEFGIVDSVEYIEDKNALNVAFRTRREAEIAYSTGKTYKGRALKISWYRAPVPPPSPAASVTSPTTPTILKKVEEELGLDLDAELRKLEDDPDAEEALLLGEDFDEEEEEEDERSWKR